MASDILPPHAPMTDPNGRPSREWYSYFVRLGKQADSNTDVTGGANITALAAFSTEGLLAYTGAGAFAGREIIAGTPNVSITNGDGVAGNPSISVTFGVDSFGEQTANTFLAAPDGADGDPTFRAIVAADLPPLPWAEYDGKDLELKGLDSAGLDDGGDVYLSGGHSVGGPGGEVGFNGGNSAADGSTGGPATLRGGNASGIGGIGGDAIIAAGTGDTPGNILLEALPTSDPGVANAVWLDGDTLKMGEAIPPAPGGFIPVVDGSIPPVLICEPDGSLVLTTYP